MIGFLSLHSTRKAKSTCYQELKLVEFSFFAPVGNIKNKCCTYIMQLTVCIKQTSDLTTSNDDGQVQCEANNATHIGLDLHCIHNKCMYTSEHSR